MTTAALPSMNVTVEDLSLDARDLDPRRAAEIYREHGCLVVRGLMKRYVPEVYTQIMGRVELAISLLDQAVQSDVGWYTPDGTLFIKAPRNFTRDKQVMVSSARYTTCGAFFQSALDPALLDIVEQVVGPDIELFMDGQCLVKEPVGGHPKMLHQDGAYFEHKYEGPIAVLCYAVDTDLNNGALHVVPGSHKLGMLQHVDTESHLGLDLNEWPWERSLPIVGEAGDAIFFHVKCIHGSKPNWSDKPRPVFIHRYRRPDDYVVIQASTSAKRETAEKLAEEAKKDNQKGFMVRGMRRQP